MKYADIDKTDGYWGDDDNLTRDGDTSESDPSSPNSSQRSETPATVIDPSGLRKQRAFTGSTKPPRQSLLMSTPSPPRNPPLIATGSFSPSLMSPRSAIEDVPGTPQSRRKYIRQALESDKNGNHRSLPEPVTPSRRRTRQTGFHYQLNDRDEEQEVSMILTDTEPEPSPMIPLSNMSLSLSSEGAFSSIANQYTPSRRAQLPIRAESMPLITRSPPTFSFAQGTELSFKIIAHDQEIQKRIDAMGISWGVQYELARGVTANLWTWSEINPDQLQKLQGTNVEAAYRVAHVMRNRPVSARDGLRLWSELDREQDAILEAKGRGLGLMGVWKGITDWYGGQIQQVGRLYKEEDKIHIKLEGMEIRRSHRFARFCGSRRILQIRIPDDIGDAEDVRKYLCSKFVLCGRVFVPFHAKEGNVYMVESNENYQRQTRKEFGDQHRISTADFINWHNPLDLNKKQAISKYATRFALGLSNSVPVIEFQEDHIIFIDDEVAPGWDKTKKPPSEKVMTDGCGFINRAGMMEITRKMKYASRPTAVQGRIAGAKGLWILDSSRDEDHLPRIWIRDSQNKIKYINYKDKSLRIFELLCVSQPSPPISLSSQTILNLNFNGIPKETLITLLEKGIEDEVTPLTDWNKPMPCLWDAIAKAGHVANTRAQRYATAGRSRALGLSRREWGPDFLKNEDAIPEGDDSEMNVDDDAIGAEYTGRNEHSGKPFGLQEFVLELIQAGFKPTELTVLRDKIRFVVQQTIDSAIEKYRIPLQESISAFVVPDPFGILKEGQIYYCSSQPLKDSATQTLFTVLKGPVLVGRYPVRLACDIQKVTAVDVPELAEWTDVVIVSIKGERSAANILSGGDYDGDELFIIREDCLVKPFKNKPFVPEPETLQQECFDVNAEKLDGFIEETTFLSTGDSQWKFQHTLLSGLNDKKVGLYSGYHEYAMFKYGYDHQNTIQMAYMFSIVLDSAKSGLKVKPDVFRKHRARFGGDIPLENENYILNQLIRAARRKGDELLSEYDRIKRKDALEDLKRPWEAARTMAKRFEDERRDAVFREELTQLAEHVKAVYDAWISACRKSDDKEKEKRQKKKQRRSREARDDAMLGVARLYSQGPGDECFLQDLERLKASYATTLNINFALSVAFQTVCDIKAKASGNGYAPSERMFDELKNMAPSAMRVLTADTVDNY